MLIVLLLFSVKAVAQTTSSFEQLPDYPFVFISNDRNAEVPAVSDSLFNACARGIQFTVNRTELRAGESFIPLYRNEIAPILRQKGLVLRKILVRGAASPEGPYDTTVASEQGVRNVWWTSSPQSWECPSTPPPSRPAASARTTNTSSC